MQTLAQIRSELKYSMAEMAQELALKKATYQSYETLRTQTPPHVLADAIAALQRVREWDKRYLKGGEADKYYASVPMFLSE